MILDPINSITSIEFYKKVVGQKLGRTFLYLSYLGLMFSVAFTFFLRKQIWPVFQETFQWLETSVPPIAFANGRLSTPTNEKVVIRYPHNELLAFTLDTSRTEPVTSRMLQDDKVSGYVTANALYVLQPGGRLDVQDFSRTPTRSAPMVVDAKLYRRLADSIHMVLYPIGLCSCFFVFLCWKLLTTVFFSLIALLINGMVEAGLGYRPLFNLSAYAQTLVIAMQTILLLVPAQVPYFGLITTIITTVYLWLAIKRNAPPLPQGL